MSKVKKTQDNLSKADSLGVNETGMCEEKVLKITHKIGKRILDEVHLLLQLRKYKSSVWLDTHIDDLRHFEKKFKNGEFDISLDLKESGWLPPEEAEKLKKKFVDKMAENDELSYETHLLKSRPQEIFNKELESKLAIAVEALDKFGDHNSECILSFYEAGEPTPEGYKTKIKGKWYLEKDIPKCNCGFQEALVKINDKSK